MCILDISNTQLGYQKPAEDVVQVNLGYTTRFFRRQQTDLNGDIAAIIPATPKGKRGGVMLAQEGGRWTVTLIAYVGNYVPEDLDGFIAFASTLPAPYIHEVVCRNEPLGEAVSARFPGSVRRRYEQLEHFPAGYLAFPGVLRRARTCAFPKPWVRARRASSSQTGTSRSCTRQVIVIRSRRWPSTA